MLFHHLKYPFDLYKAKFYRYGCLKKSMKPTNRADSLNQKPQKR